jgi:hypothetical protein
MRPSSADRGYVEPVAALGAVFAVSVGLALYAGTLPAVAPTETRQTASVVLDAVIGETETLGVLRPRALDHRHAAAGVSTNVTLATSERRWARGDTPPPRADRSSRRVSVRVGPGSVRPGRIRVAVW